MRWFSNERVLYFLLSLLIATTMWWYVANAQNPVVERSLTVDLHIQGLGSNEVVVQAPSRVQVRLQGPRGAIVQLTPAVLYASVDLYGLGPGDHQVPVYVAAPPDVRVLDRRPPEAFVALDMLARKRVPVQVDLTGSPPEGVTVGTPRLAPTSVLVSGAAREVGEVRQATVTLDTTNLHQQAASSLAVHLVDANGQEIRGLTAEPTTVQVVLPAREGVITKVVPVVPTIVGTPSPSFGVTGAAVDPATVTLTGPGNLLRNVTAVTTVQLDVTQARADVSHRVRLQIPSGVSASVRQARVVVHIGPGLLSTIFKGVPVRVVGLATGVSSEVSPGTVDIQVEGPQDLLARLSAAAVAVEVDAAGSAPGEYTIAPRALLPEGVRLLSIRPARIHVILRTT